MLSPIETRWECDGRGKASEGGEGAGSSGLGLRLGAGPGAPGSRSPNAPTCSIAGGLAGCSCPIPAGLCSIPALLSTAAAGRSIAVKAQVGPKVEAHSSSRRPSRQRRVARGPWEVKKRTHACPMRLFPAMSSAHDLWGTRVTESRLGSLFMSSRVKAASSVSSARGCEAPHRSLSSHGQTLVHNRFVWFVT